MAASSRPSSASKSSSSKSLNDYQLGDCLGKGAFGQVYRALNWATGETVAVKEIQLSNIPKNELGEIMSEIDLLKNLNHPNIVQYKGFVKAREFLYIILEFCENGSLHNIIKRFGKFPENLVAVYISQVLEGLVYLHDQGVIHRDIKGANILTDKNWDSSKTTAGARRDDAVVGSPYWMAPEVIEQIGATTASDIWSVGCVVIELLEGHPPYHNLEPMPALFRIVQDDCPPIPEGASPIVKDFLYHCFQKDCNLRISAKKLLRHPWMISARKQLAEGKGRGGDKSADVTPEGTPKSSSNYNYNYDEAVLKVQEWNEALKCPSKQVSRNARPHSPLQAYTATPPTAMLPLSQTGAWKAGSTPKAPKNLVEKIQPMAFVLQPPEEQTDNWDDDFEEGISFSKLQALDRAPTEDDKQELEDNTQTIRPNKSPARNTVPLAQPPSWSINPITEDYSDIAEADELENKVADFKMKNPTRRGLFHPDDIKVYSFGSASSGPRSAPLPNLNKKASRSSLGPLITPARQLQSQTDLEFGKYAEEEDDDYDDVFGKPSGANQPMQTLQLNTRLSNKSWLGDENPDEEDPFAEIDEGFSEDDLESNLQRDKHARLCNFVNQLIDELTPSAPDFQLRDACDQLLSTLVDNPDMQTQLVSSHGMLAILEVLESKCSRDVTMKLLQMINLLVTSDLGFLESFCLIGGIPLMMEFTSKKYPSECRLEASNFIRLLCHTSVLTLQMFISCRGLKVLVDLLDEDYAEESDLVVHALNGIGSVFELQSPTTKNDFCRMFIREGLLDPLSAALLNVMTNKGGQAMAMKKKVIQIILVFCQVSQSDIHIRNALGTRKVIRRLLRACELLEPECLVQLLKAVKHLSMNSTLLEVLQNANALEIIIRILDEQSAGPHSAEMSNHIFQTCYNLCRLDKSRQEEAVQAGIIPCLKRVINTTVGTLLWQHDGLGMYLKLLDDTYFQVSALEAIVSWLHDETARVEDELVKSESIDELVRCFVNSKANSFENLLEPILKMMRLSTPVTLAIAKLPAFFKRIIDPVCDVHPNRAMLVERYGLLGVVERLSKSDGAVLVRELAREIVPTLKPGLKAKNDTSSGFGPAETLNRSGLAPKKMRRAASETSPHVGSIQHSKILSQRTSSDSPMRAKLSRQRLGDIQWPGGDGPGWKV
ncbi:hypothetical protein F5887DRAFT_946059 [Amanita rubescens]|nr:hypothetical protein F5887DRAFT_946059 [Amanita rubescens]